MKIVTLYSTFFILSTLLIGIVLIKYIDYNRFLTTKDEIKVEKSKKSYLKRRDEFVPIRTLSTAQKEIDRILDTKLYLFDKDSTTFESNRSAKKDTNTIKVILHNLVEVLTHLEEEAILTISTYSEQNGSKVYNLKLSQKRADILKEYFREKTSLPLVVAIGYGGAIPIKEKNKIKHRQVEISLKRIK